MSNINNSTIQQFNNSLLRIKNFLALFLLLFLVACGSQDTTPEPPALNDLEFGNIVSASGKVMPVRWANMGFENGGRLTSVAEEGSEVRAGASWRWPTLPTYSKLFYRPRLHLAIAEAQLSRAQAEAREEDLAAADGAVQVAQGHVSAAKGGLQQTKSNNSTAVKTAEAQVAQAEAEVGRALAELALLQSGARPQEIAALQARVNQLQSEFLIAENCTSQTSSTKISAAVMKSARAIRAKARATRASRLRRSWTWPTPAAVRRRSPLPGPRSARSAGPGRHGRSSARTSPGYNGRHHRGPG